MDARGTLKTWRHSLWKFISHPATEATAVVAIVVVSLWTLATSDARFVRKTHFGPVIFAPR
jgi:hypothetical protein